jgi:hypothetical protein
LEIECIEGDRAAAVAALVQQAQQSLKEAIPRSPRPSDASEMQLLQRIIPLTPATEGDDGDIYELPGSLPLVVAVSKAGEEPRVAFCGLALGSEQGWTLYGVRRFSAAETLVVSLPPGGEIIISLQESPSQATIVFAGPATPAEWIAFYRTWMADHGWSVWHDWSHVGEAWQAVYIQHATGQQVDVQLCAASPGALRGVLVWSASSTLIP